MTAVAPGPLPFSDVAVMARTWGEIHMIERLARPRRALIASAALGAAVLLPLQATTTGGAPAAAATSDACGPVLTKADGTPWQCSFVDNFSGRDVDTTKWLVGDTSWSGYRTGVTCYTASTKNVAVRNGELQLTARRESRPFTCNSPYGSFTTQYTGGHVATFNRFAQAYGRYEVRAALPSNATTGLHGGAFWLYPQKQAYGAWPASGEIDVAEWWSAAPTTLLPTLHYSGSTSADSGWGCTVADPSQFHTYGLEWTTTEMRFFIDGTMCFQRSWTPDSPLVAPQPFDQPFNIVMNLGVGDTSGSNAVSASTSLPATYHVDYVKAWR
jgi:beta-glucanase (GH16 family)